MLNDNPKTIYLWSDPYCITIHFIIRQLYLTIQSPWNRETFIPSASRSREAALPNEPDGEAPNASASLPKAAQRRPCAGSELVDQPHYCLPCHWTPCEHYTHKYKECTQQLNRSASVLWALLQGYLSMQDGVRYTFDIEVHLGQWDEVHEY
jgi:hypothetical protein